MKRKGIHVPTIENLIETSGIETLHPGGFALTRRTAELLNLRKGMTLLDVSSGRGTQAIYYAKEFDVAVTGVDISAEMIQTATVKAHNAGLDGKVHFRQGDSQNLPFENNMFDAAINECAVGIPDDSQKVLDEMVRVVKPKGVIAIHESTWNNKISEPEKDEISERYGTTPLEYEEWLTLLEKAGIRNITTEFKEWSKPEMFWNIRAGREIKHPAEVLTWPERMTTLAKVWRRYGIRGVVTAFENEKIFYRAVLSGKIGYCLFKGEKR